MRAIHQTFVIVGCVLCFGIGSVRAQFHEGDMAVGRSAAGQLKVANVPFLPLKLLNPVSGLLNGFTDGNPGFNRINVDQPDADFFQLQSGAQITLRLLQADPALKFWRNNLSANLSNPGDELLLGDHQLHYHGTWHIDSKAAGYDADRAFWEATFVILDTGSTGYSQSEPFTARFANRPNSIPTVSDWGLAVLILTLLCAGTLTIRRAKLAGGTP
jgi:hypothetical protein